MRFAVLTTLSVASCIFCFVACGGDEADPAETDPDGGDGTTTSSGGSSGNGSSSGDPGDSGGGGGDDDDDDASKADAGDAGADAGDAGEDPALAKLPPSCKASKGKGPGIDTCGATEAASDDCCKSLALPKTAKRTLDKYEITAGRMRAFVDAVPNIRQFAKDFAKANPSSQLGKVASGFPAKGDFGSYLDTLPKQTNAKEELDEAVFLGAFPVDAINAQDGCFISPGGYGAATFWQPPANLKPYEIGLENGGDGKRKYGKDVLDTKALNCVSAMMLATFCAWDGGELARTSDYHEVWGTQKVVLPGAGGATVFVPWNDVVPWGQFNWRNGHDGDCPKGWPGCVKPALVFYSFPTANAKPSDDDSPEIGAPGRFPKDVTKAVSPDGGGWFDIGGNLMELAWPNTSLVPGTKDFCDTSAGAGGGATACNRNQPGDPRPGTLRYKGATPPTVLVGYSFEVHAHRSEKYLSAATDDETLIASGDVKPAHFQYGKIGGRCVRVVK